jgi:hypothetical protein
MIKAPLTKLPDDNANPWATRVNPHGRKKVAAPIKNGIDLPLKFCSLAMKLPKDFGSVNLMLFAQLTSNICSPKISIRREIIIVIIALTSVDIVSA